jgi:hypothetical protein
MNIDRTGSMPQRRRFEHETTEALQARVDDMEGWLIGSAWAERLSNREPDRKLNRAYMTARAFLADRQGNPREASRLRGTLDGIERGLGPDISNPRANRRDDLQADPDALLAGAEIARRLRSLLGIQVQQVGGQSMRSLAEEHPEYFGFDGPLKRK